MADLVGKIGELLRGQSKYRFSLQIYPEPSRYYEVGRCLAIPMAPPVKGSRDRTQYFVLDIRGVTEWTSPKLPIDRAHLEQVVRKIVDREKIGVIGL